jgi:urease accessory protein
MSSGCEQLQLGGESPWLGSVELEFAQAGSRTVVARRRHQGPLQIQRAFHEPDGSCQVYLIHPPGGVVGGDQLLVRVVAEAGARALITTPAATKLYRSLRSTAKLEQRFDVRRDGRMEWLPLETIVYDGARAESHTEVQLAQSAEFVGWEVTCFGRDDTGFQSGRLVQSWKIARGGQRLWSERLDVLGGSPLLSAPWGLARRPVLGTLVATGARSDLVDELRSVASVAPEDWTSVTLLGEVLVCRYLGYSSESARHFFSRAWALLRDRISGRRANAPRVWAT